MFIPQRTEASIAAEKAGHGTYAVDWATADDRIRLCKGIVTDTNQQMDPERLSVLKAVYEEEIPAAAPAVEAAGEDVDGQNESGSFDVAPEEDFTDFDSFTDELGSLLFDLLNRF